MRYRYYTADVFTDRVFGGNPLAVFPDGRGLSGAQMQRAAREMNLSETVFVLPPDDPAHSRRLRIFTPAVEMPFAGHPTIGTGYVLAAVGEIAVEEDYTHLVFEEGVGPVPVTIHEDGRKPTLVQLSAPVMPEFSAATAGRPEVAAALSLAPGDLAGGADDIEAVSCGVPFLYVPVRDRAALARARIDAGAWQRALAESWAPSVFVFCRDPELPGSDLRARMFAPALGVAEDPATGAAATALAGYLCARESAESGTFRWIVEQGFEMGRPSIIEVEAAKDEGAVSAIRVGGRSVLVCAGEMEIPDAGQAPA